MNTGLATRLFVPLVALACATSPSTPDDPGAEAPSNPVFDTGCTTVGIEAGDCAPDFTLLDADGTSVRLADRLGERVVVVGSSLWCSRCRSLVQDLSAWYATADDVTVLNVIVQGVSGAPGTVEDAATWRDQFDLPWEVLADSDEAFADEWGDPNSRTYNQHTYTVIDREGRVTWHDFGEDDNVVPSIAAAIDAIE